MDRRLKVLVAAYACNPFRGSEEGVGWGWVRSIAAYHDLWVLTAEFHREDIEKARRQDPARFQGIEFCYVPHRPWHYRPTPAWIRIENSCFKPLMNRAYRFWQRDAWELGRSLHARIGFDLVHQLTYVGFRFPGHLWKMPVPFVWGPIGGLENTPWRFLPMLGPGGCVYYGGRNLINSAHRRWLVAPRRAFRAARGGIIAATQGIRRQILRWYGEESEVIAEVGPPESVAADVIRREAGEPLRISWSGMHLPGKALPLLLLALLRAGDRMRWSLDILGSGPCTPKWRKMAEHIGIADRCRWLGRRSRDEAIAAVRNSHVFVMTSIKDLTSTVILEALAQGVPVVCPDHCGFADVVNSDCGIKVPVIRPAQLVAGIADALIALEGDERERQRLAAGALKRVAVFRWDCKAAQVDRIYQRKIAG